MRGSTDEREREPRNGERPHARTGPASNPLSQSTKALHVVQHLELFALFLQELPLFFELQRLQPRLVVAIFVLPTLTGDRDVTIPARLQRERMARERGVPEVPAVETDGQGVVDRACSLLSLLASSARSMAPNRPLTV
jgi:hypothetical protein